MQEILTDVPLQGRIIEKLSRTDGAGDPDDPIRPIDFALLAKAVGVTDDYVSVGVRMVDVDLDNGNCTIEVYSTPLTDKAVLQEIVSRLKTDLRSGPEMRESIKQTHSADRRSAFDLRTDGVSLKHTGLDTVNSENVTPDSGSGLSRLTGVAALPRTGWERVKRGLRRSS